MPTPLLALVLLALVLPAACDARPSSIAVAKCRVRCSSAATKSCTKDCLLKEEPKPGKCPATRSPDSSTCTKTCGKDSDCQGVSKCCQQTCGTDCQTPVDLATIEGLPDIPKTPRVMEKRKKKQIIIDWSSNQRSAPEDILYVIEERHHTGKDFDEKEMTKWTLCAKSVKPRKALRQLVMKPGRWYQFRVAGVNVNGTRGFSNSSLPFRISANPKPPKAPDNVTVGQLVKANGSLSTIIKWLPPDSDLPIIKYKVFWSRRIFDRMALDSVLVHQKVVPKHQTYLKLENLQPNSLYFLQVQAMVQVGEDILRGEKSGLVLNTTSYINDDNNDLVLDTNNNFGEQQLLRLAFQKGNLQARVILKHPGKPHRKYHVKWWNSSFRLPSNRKNAIKQNAIIRGSHFDISDLQFDSRYKISIKYVSKMRKKSGEDAFITFTTPKCTVLQKTLRRLKCN